MLLSEIRCPTPTSVSCTQGRCWGEAVPPYAAFARATNYPGLPPTITFVSELRPFCDKTLAYVDHLREAGVPVDIEL
jgi:acetyl esterase/lipase